MRIVIHSRSPCVFMFGMFSVFNVFEHESFSSYRILKKTVFDADKVSVVIAFKPFYFERSIAPTLLLVRGVRHKFFPVIYVILVF